MFLIDFFGFETITDLHLVIRNDKERSYALFIYTVSINNIIL